MKRRKLIRTTRRKPLSAAVCMAIVAISGFVLPVQASDSCVTVLGSPAIHSDNEQVLNDVLADLAKLRSAIDEAQQNGLKSLAFTLAADYKRKLEEATKLGAPTAKLHVELIDQADTERAKTQNKARETEKRLEVFEQNLSWGHGEILPNADSITEAVANPVRAGILLRDKDEKISLYNEDEKKLVYTVPTPMNVSVREPVWSADGSRFAFISRMGGLEIWTFDGGLVRVIPPKYGNFAGVSLSTDGARALTLPMKSANEAHATLWNVKTGEKLFDFGNGQNRHLSGALNSDGKRVYTWSYNSNDVELWNSESGEKVTTLHTESGVLDCRFSKDGKYLAVRSGSTAADFFDAENGRSLGRIVATENSLRTLVFASNRHLMATAQLDGIVTVWDRETYQLAHSFKVDDSDIILIRFINDGTVLLVTTASGTVAFFNLSSGRVIARYTHETIARVKTTQPLFYKATISSRENSLVTIEYKKGPTLWRSFAPGVGK